MEKLLKKLIRLADRYLLSLTYLGVLLVCLSGLATHKGFVESRLSLHSYELIGIFLIVLLLLRLAGGVKPLLTWKLKRVNGVIFLLSSFIAIVLFLLEAFNYPNFIYSTLHINHVALLDIVILSFSLHILTAPSALLKKYYPTYILIAFLIICNTIYFYSTEYFLQLSLNANGSYDDNFMEWLQVYVLGAGIIISIVLGLKAKKRLLQVIYTLSTVFFAILLGEEISYGERMYSLGLPALEGNYQGEFNIHNQAGANEITMYLYVAAFFYALLSWIVYRIALNKNLITKKTEEVWDIFCFKGQEVFYFVPTLIFNPYGDRAISENIPYSILSMYESAGLLPDFITGLAYLAEWRETFEVIFYAGLVIHFLNIYIRQRKNR